jgi:hypothetical protein
MTNENLAGELCRCGDILRFPLGNQTELVYSKDSRQARVFPVSGVNYLLGCRDFRTLEQHARGLQSSGPGQGTFESVMDQLKDFLNEGFLVFKNDILKRIQDFSKRMDTKSISSVCFPTRNRIESLKRGLSSFVENTQRFGRTVNFIVADNSEAPDTRKKYREALGDLKNRYGAKISYAGLEEKKEFARQLVARDLPPHVVHFALFGLEETGYGSGANRNSLLLAAAGEAVLMTDDDTVCKLTHAPGAGKALTFLSGQDPAEHCFYPDQDTLLKTVPFVEEDILSIHEQFLGKDLGTCLSHSQPNFDRASASFLRKLASEGGNILVTQTGIIGDSGSGSPTALLSLTGESRNRFLRSEQDYRRTVMNRLELSKANFPSVTDADFCMTTSLGLDLGNLLPPFLPVHRNSDGIFGVALRNCFRNGFIAHLPWAVLHLPLDEARSFLPENIWDTPVDFQIDEIISQSIRLSNAPDSQMNGEAMLKKIGKNLMRLGALELRDFANVLTSRMLNSRKFYIDYLQNSLKIYKAEPSYWAEDVRKRVGKIMSTLEKGEDLSGSIHSESGRRPEISWVYRQNLVKRFGELFYHWPEMINAVRLLREQGQGIAQLV